MRDVTPENDGFDVGIVTAATLAGFAMGIIPSGASPMRIMTGCVLIAIAGLGTAAVRGYQIARRSKDDETSARAVRPHQRATTATERLILEVRRIETKDWTAGQIRIWSPPDEHSG